MTLYSPANIVAMYDALDEEYPSLRRGGVAAAKTGYHDSVKGNKAKDPNDYSIRLALDLKGDFDAARAIDITLSDAEMIKGSKRLLAACQSNDGRLFGMREFIGTVDGKQVIAYNMKGDGHGGSRSTAGVKYGSQAGDPSHLWHIHISFYTYYATNKAATEAVTQILLGEDDMALSQEDIDKIAKAVWDSKAVDMFTPPPGEATDTNKTWKAKSELEWLVENVDAIRKAVEQPPI